MRATTFREFVEAKDGKRHIRLALSVDGEPEVTDRGKTKEKKGKHKIVMAWDLEGEPTLVRQMKK